MDGDCKVDRAAGRYDIEVPGGSSVGDALRSRWRGEGGHPEHGYRTLTEWFNKRLLRAAYDEAGRETLGNRVETDYEALTGEDDLVRREVVEHIRADGVDVEAVQADMVSWGTMRTHLKECLDATKSRSTAASDWERESVEMARSFAGEKVESALSALASKGELAGVDRSSVAVEIQLRCEACPTVVPLDVALGQGYVCADHSHADRSDG